MGSTPVGGSENMFSEYFDLENASSLLTTHIKPVYSSLLSEAVPGFFKAGWFVTWGCRINGTCSQNIEI